MTRMKSDDQASSDRPVTLTEAHISSVRVTRRALLGTLGLGAGLAAAAIVSGASARERRRKFLPKRRGQPPETFEQIKKQSPSGPNSFTPKRKPLCGDWGPGISDGDKWGCIFDF